MKLAYILILLVLLFIASLYVWNTVQMTRRVPIHRADEIRYYPVVEYPVNEYPYYYGWWWPWYGGSYNIVGSRYGSPPPHRDWRNDGHSSEHRDRHHGGLPGVVPPAPGATPGGHSAPSSGATAPGDGGHTGPAGGGATAPGDGGHTGPAGGGGH